MNPTIACKPLPTTEECPQLSSLKALDFAVLISIGQDWYKDDLSVLEMTVSSIFNDTSLASPKHRLAEAFYYRQGTLLVDQDHVKQLTRLQAEHECAVRALATREQIAASTRFQLEVLLTADLRQAQYDAQAASLRYDSGYDSNERQNKYATEDEILEPDMDENCEEEKKEKAIYVKVWKDHLGRFVTYRF